MNLFSKVGFDTDDAALVMHSLGGDRDAFCEIVTRYQTLLCSIAYSSVGDIKHSEDIAQEAFVEAWRKLDTLKDPAKLKSWLCGILRFKISRFKRKELGQPAFALNDAQEQTLADLAAPNMDQSAIEQQQQVLLRKALDGIDETYREPLILFYREQRSIERVAAELELSEDTVKQRLSRGRKLLKKAMSIFVEDALEKTKPGVAFTAGVLAAISSISPPAKAAALGASAAKTSSMFSGAIIITILASISGLISGFFGLRSSLDQSRTEQERQLTIKFVTLFMLSAVLFVGSVFGLRQLVLLHQEQAWLYASGAQILVIVFIVSYFILVSRAFGAIKNQRAHERIFNPDAFTAEVDQVNAKQREYKSEFQLFGVPLVHFQFGMLEVTDKPAFGWIAGGTYARGLLFAWGGVAIAPVSVGIISYGIFTIGAIGIGIFSVGAVAVGIISFGTAAIGYKAYSALSSLGWESAFSNGFSIAKDAAIGPIAFAQEVNNEVAAQLSNLTTLGNVYQWVLATIAILVIIPSVWHSTVVRKRMKLDK